MTIGRTRSRTPPSRPRRAAGQDPAKRRRILDGARRVFSTLGFDAASMNDIRAEASVSKGTLYVYFENKEQLFVAPMQEERERFSRDLFEGVPGDSDVAEALRRLGRRLPRLLTQPRILKAQRVVIGISERMPELSASFDEQDPCATAQRLASILDAHAAAGRLAVADTRLAAAQFLDLCQSTIVRARLFGFFAGPPSDAEIDRVVEAAVVTFMAAFGRPATDPRSRSSGG